ncbi:MAG: ETC complex I subunit [Mesorhizobium sp.]|uniref:NADH dehydrogenase ubiquinone Fe-S protein 4 n=1 Tax=Mesorhizobium sp. TaxID=1871066 RepID=UPI000FE659F6|nr:NADH dehydrogenase ubiquinone Fe-S protein 4 [Mesorhizobium sp.]RWM10990.1 MAG: ETC complex I subunit [Mesorhizobium sp.]TIP71604.1 MAG: ETC complex I subunit [Mesorhizobium sp.]TIQ06241.1 MAG: ETC complex I subunit [Mesorhizobium sp.]TIR47382.1 MAG: ETC complex I subunit [Mesorhizobium sp.]TJV92679.1 MAG: ETC complex I subunit [Mesorhizobium sp.]
MMEMQRSGVTQAVHHPGPANDNCRKALSFGQSEFPRDAIARIYKPCRSAMTSGRARPKGWRLVFEARAAPVIEPLMGCTGGRDTLTQVELNFPTLQSAIDYAERQGLAYVVQGNSAGATSGCASSDAEKRLQAGADVVWNRLQLAWLQSSYGAVSQAPHYGSALADPEALYTSPMDVVGDPLLTVEEKRSILRNWAWNEYLVDLATGEGMPENERPARLDEVELALLVLERGRAAANLAVSTAEQRGNAA